MKAPVPETLEDAVVALGSLLGEEDKVYVLGGGGCDFTFIQVQIQVLRCIRNEWGLWQGSALFEHMKRLGYSHPDDMSRRIWDEFVRMGGRSMPPTRFDRWDDL